MSRPINYIEHLKSNDDLIKSKGKKSETGYNNIISYNDFEKLVATHITITSNAPYKNNEEFAFEIEYNDNITYEELHKNEVLKLALLNKNKIIDDIIYVLFKNVCGDFIDPKILSSICFLNKSQYIDGNKLILLNNVSSEKQKYHISINISKIQDEIDRLYRNHTYKTNENKEKNKNIVTCLFIFLILCLLMYIIR